MIIYAITSTGITFNIFADYFWYYLLAIILFAIVGVMTLYILKTKDIIRELPPLISTQHRKYGFANLFVCIWIFRNGVSAAISSFDNFFHFTLGVF